MSNPKSTLVGQRFGRLLVIEESERRTGLRRWHVVCDCGNRKVVYGQDLKAAKTQSCGCFMKERRVAAHTTHGQCDTPEYSVWKGMLERCTNPSFPSYSYYGGRGITVCDAWRNFAAFFSDMGQRPSRDHQLDRIDNDGPYSPENCRWATRSQNLRNTRANALVFFGGREMTLVEASEISGIDYGTLRQRRYRGQELFAPPRYSVSRRKTPTA